MSRTHRSITETRRGFSDRRCVNAACRLDFTTREQVMSRRDDNRLCARTRASQIETSRPPAAGVEAGRTSSPGPCAPSAAAEEDATEVQEGRHVDKRRWQYDGKSTSGSDAAREDSAPPNPHVRMAAATLTRFSVRHEAGALWVAGIICTQERLATRKGDWVGEGRGAGTAGRRPRKKPAGRPRRTCAS